MNNNEENNKRGNKRNHKRPTKEEKDFFEEESRPRSSYYDSIKRRFDLKRSPVERVADRLVALFGSMAFLTVNFLWFGVWIILNTNVISGVKPFDPFPFGLLTMIVSLEAIVLSVIVLISQNRESKISNLRSEIDTRIDILAEEEITKVLELVIQIAKKNDINISSDKQLQRLLKPMNKSYLEKKFKGQV